MTISIRAFASVVGFVLLSIGLVAQNNTKPLLENDRVRVSRIDLAKGASLPTDTRYEAVTVQVGEGDTQFIDPTQLAKTEPHGVGQVHYFVARSKRAIKNGGKSVVPVIQVQFLRPQGKYVAFDVPPTHYCNSESGKACVTERYMFCTDRFCAENVTQEPGGVSTYHTHADDYLIVALSDFTWRDEAVSKTPEDVDFKAGDVKYMKAGARHRLTNTGKTTANVFVIQFK